MFESVKDIKKDNDKYFCILSERDFFLKDRNALYNNTLYKNI